MKFVKLCPRIPGTYPADTGKLCKALSPGGAWDSPGELQSPVPGFPAHILRTPANSAKLCPRVGRGIPPGNCKALSQDSRHISLRTPANSAKLCPRIPGTYPADTGKLYKALSPGHGKAGRHDYGYSLQKKNGGKTAVPDTLCFFNNLWRFQARGQFPFL